MISSAVASRVGDTSIPSASRGLQIDHQLELDRLFDRQIGRLGAFENLVHKRRSARVHFAVVWPVGHKAPSLDQFAVGVNAGKALLPGEVHDPIAAMKKYTVRQHDERSRLLGQN